LIFYGFLLKMLLADFGVELAKKQPIKLPCVHCKHAHSLCDGDRPCSRCVRLKKDECIDAPRLKPGRKRIRVEGNTSQSPITSSKVQHIASSNQLVPIGSTSKLTFDSSHFGNSFVPVEPGKTWAVFNAEQKVIAASNEFCTWVDIPRPKLLNKTWREFVAPTYHIISEAIFAQLLSATPIVDSTKTFCRYSFLQRKTGQIIKCYIKHVVTLIEEAPLSISCELIGYYPLPVDLTNYVPNFSILPAETESFNTNEYNPSTNIEEEFFNLMRSDVDLA